MSTKELEIHQISFNEVVEFFSEKKVNGNCPACEFSNAAIISSSNEIDAMVSIYAINPVAQFIEKTAIIDKESSTFNIITECLNCGYRRHFGVGPILNWLNTKEKNKP